MEVMNNGKLAQQLVEEAIKNKASDVHVEPLAQEVRVRMRIDGILQELCRLPWSSYATLVSQLKVLSGMDIAEKRVPQDGRWQVNVEGRSIDLRLSTLPTIRGEKVVVRILDREQGVRRLEDLGMSTANLRSYRQMTSAANGLVLLTGPTGSGKTTSLYATLQELEREGLNLVTVEDPVEFKLEGVNQVAVNRKAGLDFATGLRALVRQDPDIIMVGEIRDRETAAMAVQAALTGHLVFSTLHTNSAVGAVARLLDMGVEAYLLAAALQGVLAQRLVRRLCPRCAERYTPTPLEQQFLALATQLPTGAPSQRLLLTAAGKLELNGKPLQLMRGRGCEHCRGTGHAGRMAVQELLPVDEYMSGLISAGAGKAALLSHGTSLGWRSLYADGVEKVLAGQTTVSELWRVGITGEEIATMGYGGGEGVQYVH
ncbi:MAG: GspE/PulE family protein [Phascolarctobacterium sp.]